MVVASYPGTGRGRGHWPVALPVPGHEARMLVRSLMYIEMYMYTNTQGTASEGREGGGVMGKRKGGESTQVSTCFDSNWSPYKLYRYKTNKIL